MPRDSMILGRTQVLKEKAHEHDNDPIAQNDDKHVKFALQQSQLKLAQDKTVRRVCFYVLLASYIADLIASKGESANHLTLWSWFLHMLYFELHIASSYTMTKLLHGPSMAGAHALFAMYLFTLYANPNMEFDLAPAGRATWLVYVRAFHLHFSPVLFHWIDIRKNKEVLCDAYHGYGGSKVLMFWASVGGYFAMGLTWEQLQGEGGGADVYNITSMSPETYMAICKAVGILSCILSFYFITYPTLMRYN